MPATSTNRFVHFLVRRRVPISIAVFGVLLTEDVVTGTVPCDIFDWTDYKAVSGIVCVLGGLLIRTWAAGFLTKSTQLTTVGPYRVVRNPLYLGSFLMVVGFCLLVNDFENIWIGTAALILLYVPKVRSEEHYLAGRFPDEWRNYAAQTPRFLPRLTTLPSVAGWRLTLWLKSREYNAVVASLVAIAALKALHEMHS
jgi:protein-S-isoprenylcysteine O-methyltransferase Ste14